MSEPTEPARLKLSHTNTGADIRYRLREESGPATYTVEGLVSLATQGKITPDTEVAREGDDQFKPISTWSFAETLFPPKRKFTFKPAAPLKPYAEPPLEITSEEQLREIMRRDPHDIRATMLLSLVKERAAREGRTVPELLEEFFVRKRAELAAAPRRPAAPVRPVPPPEKNTAP